MLVLAQREPLIDFRVCSALCDELEPVDLAWRPTRPVRMRHQVRRRRHGAGGLVEFRVKRVRGAG